MVGPLRVRWLGRVRYRDAYALQRALFERADDDYLLLLEHPHVFTLGVRGTLDHVLVPPASVGAEVVRTDRGGDVTYHGPGQLVGYPVLTLPTSKGGLADTVRYVQSVEQVVVDVCRDLGLAHVGRLPGFPGVWVEPDSRNPRKIAAVGVKLSRARTMHGFALNVDPDLSWFERIVPCGITGKAITSLRAEGLDVPMRTVVDAVVARAAERWGHGDVERTDTAWRSPGDRTSVSALAAPAPAPSPPVRSQPVRLLGRLARAGVDADAALPLAERKPDWLRVKAEMGAEYRSLKRTMRELRLVTVCEEAGCPNIFECWADGTATFMINGSRCTRACGFCLVDTQHPAPLDAGEPEAVAEAVARLRLAHAVVTAVARDDLPDGGAQAFADVVRAVRRRRPTTAVELLIPDCKGDPDALDTIFAARPDVLNHNLETVARLQQAVRPSAGYARSLAVLARAADAGLTTKSGMILGMGETDDEVRSAMADLRAVGVEILTLGQYLRPTAQHLPVVRWWTPQEFDALRRAGERMGFAHVQASPLTRSSYHARSAADAVARAQDAGASATSSVPAGA